MSFDDVVYSEQVPRGGRDLLDGTSRSAAHMYVRV